MKYWIVKHEFEHYGKISLMSDVQKWQTYPNSYTLYLMEAETKEQAIENFKTKYHGILASTNNSVLAAKDRLKYHIPTRDKITVKRISKKAYDLRKELSDSKNLKLELHQTDTWILNGKKICSRSYKPSYSETHKAYDRFIKARLSWPMHAQLCWGNNDICYPAIDYDKLLEDPWKELTKGRNYI